MKNLFSFLLVTVIIVPAFTFASIDANLKYGARGPEVTELQEFLIANGFLSGPSTGNFYSLTRKAVIAYQQSVGLTASGFVGPLTRAQINKVLAEGDASTSGTEIAETGTTTPPMTESPVDLLKKQVALLMQQLQAMQQQASTTTQILQSQLAAQAQQAQLVQTQQSQQTAQVQQTQKIQESLNHLVTNTTPAQTTQPATLPMNPLTATTTQQATMQDVPQLTVSVSSNKSQIAGNGQDAATITVKILDADGQPVANKTVYEYSPISQIYKTDANGIASFSASAAQAGNLLISLTVDNKTYTIPLTVVNTTANVYANLVIPTSVRAPASDQLLAILSVTKIDPSISDLKLTAMKIKLVNLDKSWFQNVRITSGPTCGTGKFCTVQTIAGPASYSLDQNGILSITPDTPVDIYTSTPISVIADMISTPSFQYGTGDPIQTYQILLPSVSSIVLSGKVNGFENNTINLVLSGALAPVTATVNSNTCNSKDTPVACY